MINILVKVKNVMNKILSAASVVLLVFMTSLVLAGVYKICAWQTSSIYRRTC